MIFFTRQEKMAAVFLVSAVICGSCLLLIKKRHPAFFAVLAPGSPARFHRKINIHSASLEEWESLPGIGPYRAGMIMSAREDRGGFRTVDDVRYVKGIGPYIFNQIRDRLTDE